MLNGFAGNAVVDQTVAEASDALGIDIGKLIAEGPKEDLDLTTNTQPVMLTAAVAVYRAWIAAGGPVPAMVAGHSLGEYSALVAAGVIAFKDAVPLVRFRAQAMQEAVPVGQGGMAVVLGLSADDVRAVCREAAAEGEVVEAVNFNEPTQIVIAGHAAAIDRACEIAKAKGAKRAMKLAVSAPFHSSLLKAGLGPPARVHGPLTFPRRRSI
jgi:[acyl-carrier-protein] S-malonyltransferase